ncbi:MAG: hypothetical protein LBE57_07680 [Methanosarcinales archaeon]|jgi:hypothetical protein|nr:hypothetical protein [Methanosarcinales archaeon]
MNSKIVSFLLTLLLLLTIFSAGTAAALENDAPPNELLIDPVLDYPYLVYISGTTVTIELNHEISPNSPNYYTFSYYMITGPGGSSGWISYVQLNADNNTVQFEVTEAGDYTIHFCGSFSNTQFVSPTYISTHRGHYLTFTVIDLNKTDAVESENCSRASGREDAEPKLAVYPSKSFFTYTCGSSSRTYHTSFYEHLFIEEAYPKLYPGLLEALSENNAIYSFYGNNLRSMSWYDAESSAVSMTGGRQISLSNGYFIDISAYKPELTVNILRVPDFSLNYIFICSDFDHTEHIDSIPSAESSRGYTNITHIHKPKPCSCSLEWRLFVNGIFKENASGCFSQYTAPADGENLNENCNIIVTCYEKKDEVENPYPNYIMFNNLCLLKDDLSLSRTISISIYPKVVGNNGDDLEETEESIPKPDLTWSNAPVSFTVKRESLSFSFSNLQKGEDGRLNLRLKDCVSPPVTSALSNLSFPAASAEILVGSDAELIVEALTKRVIENVETDLIDDETLIHSVINVDFSDPAIKADLNEKLKSQNEQIALEFEVPAVDSSGSPISANELAVFHVFEIGGVQEMEQLKINVASKRIDGSYYVVTTYTTSFSLFVIASAESELVNSSGSNSYGEATVVPENRTADTSEAPEPPSNGYSSLPPVGDIISKIQGYLSLFSILVVLTSGLFMWDYIRRRI